MCAKSRLELRLKNLVEGVGGPTRLSQILDRFYSAMSRDTMIGFFFSGKDLHSIAKTQAAFILKAAGVAPHYSGKLPNHAHMGLPPILKGHFDRRMVILKETLTREGIAPDLIQVWIEFEEAFRNVVQSNGSPH